jgi:hypothetical protein
MATSGTWSFNLNIAEIIEEAYERIGKELRTGYDYKTARRSLDMLLLEWQNRGLNLWTVKNASQTLTAGTASYALSAEKLDVIEASIRTDAGDTSKQTDISMERISVSQYAHISNKLATGKPIQYWVNRQPEAITLTVWPVPDSATTYVMNYYYLERHEDSGTPASNNVDVPARFLPPLTAGLAYYLALKNADTMQMGPILKTVYEEQWNLAADAARDKSSLWLIPGGIDV